MSEQTQLLPDAIETPELACWLVDLKSTFFDPTTYARLDDATRITWANLVVIASTFGQRVRKFQVIGCALVVPDSIIDESDKQGLLKLREYGMISATRSALKTVRPKENAKPTGNAAREVGLEEFEKFWAAYPARGNSKPFKTQAKRWFFANINTNEQFAELITATNNYAASGRVMSGYVRDVTNWLAEDHWKSWISHTEEAWPDKITSRHGHTGRAVV